MITDAIKNDYYQVLFDKHTNHEGAPHPSMEKQVQVLKASWLETPLGPMVAIASDEALYVLEFVISRRLERAVQRLRKRTDCIIIPGTNPAIVSIEQELKAWFEGTLRVFKTPLYLLGSPFQNTVWGALCRIPYGETRTYMAQALMIQKPSASRAVANAHGANLLAIIIPCHRIINSNGNLGGYGGGIERKRWLINHEKQQLLSR
jgi:AraC family transcriptional regulator of adaptative response/methylated-DNA-[protein]-cysteine methyltransferase